MTTTTCPHQTEAVRTRACKGCTIKAFQDETAYVLVCQGEITGRVYADSEGDAGVIGGINNFLTVEDEDADCMCDLSDDEWNAVRDALVENARDEWAGD